MLPWVSILSPVKVSVYRRPRSQSPQSMATRRDQRSEYLVSESSRLCTHRGQLVAVHFAKT